MGRKPNPQAQDLSLLGLLDLSITQLDSVITKPSILSYKGYPAQDAFHRCDLTGRYMSAGNRAGKTTSAVVEAIYWATNTHPYLKRPEKWGQGPLRMRFVVVDVEKGVNGIILPELKRWTTSSMLINGSFDDSWNNSSLTFTFQNGSTIQFLTHGMDLDKHGGTAMHLIFFDEIPPRAVFNENMMRLVDYEGRWVLAATSVEGMGWTYEKLWEPAFNYNERQRKEGADPRPLKDEDADIGIFELSQKDNPFLQTEIGVRGKYYVGMDEQERKIREDGSFVPRSGRIFPNWNIHDHVLATHMPVPRGWKLYSSVDFGFSNPTAWLWHAVSPNGDVYTFGEHYKSQMTVEEHATIVRAKEGFWKVDPDEIMRVGDPAGKQKYGTTGTSYLSEYSKRGIYIGVEGIPHEVSIGIEIMQQYVRLERSNGWGKNKPRWMISPNCVNLIGEMKKLRWASFDSAKKADETNKQETVHKKDDHAFDSARYFFTFMPDLAPSLDEVIQTFEKETGVQMSYEQVRAAMEADDRVEFVKEKDPWDTEFYDVEEIG